MTSELKTLMTRATERPTSFAPDVEQLVAVGRHRTRVHRVLVSAATIACTATALIVALLVVHPGDARPTPPPAAVVQPAAVTDLCAKSDDFPRTANDDTWRRQVVANWTDKVVEVTDADGSITVRRSPDGTQYAYCVAGVPIRGQALERFGSMPLNVGIIARQHQIQRYWSEGCGDDPNTDRSTCGPAGGIRYSYAGRVPDGVTRIAFTGLGQHGDATINDGYWALRVYTDDITKGNTDPVFIEMYDGSGKQVFKQRY
jgi:hypothetical protein